MYFYDKTLFVCFIITMWFFFPRQNLMKDIPGTTCIRVEIFNTDIYFDIIILFCIQILVLNVISLYIDVILQSVLSTGRNIFQCLFIAS